MSRIYQQLYEWPFEKSPKKAIFLALLPQRCQQDGLLTAWLVKNTSSWIPTDASFF
jgi:hypothetical protein